ncbi:MAG TPA: wax ester/triacylglycerol synthase family O-acyltransferase [Thermoleophilaceae bacterium]|nr:wax ester/triacylglycerol synthase family O-acyltransferase [Thermoleophilaceae bacterium]
MTQGHKDRLTAIDASFLHQERSASHMHVGAITILEGPPPSREEFAEHMESRLHLVPRYRQKLSFPRFEMGRPFWTDDPRFNIDYHVRHSGLAAPGTLEQLRGMAGRIFSQRLDRSKPLWELWLVQGLEGARFALISKTHHALVDGVAGVDIATVLFDQSPVPQKSEEEHPWEPSPQPSQTELVAEGVKGLIRTPGSLAGEAIKAVRSPRKTLGRAMEAVEGVGEVAWAGFNPAPDVPLNVPIGPHRRVVWLQCELADFKAIKDGLGGTVNDAFLTVVAGGLGRWLRSRGVRTEGLELRGLVPVSIRAEGDAGSLGNRIAAVRGPLPVYAEDPVERLRIVREAMQGIKESKQALGAEVISGLEDFAPPTLLAMASRLNFSTRLFNLIVTNVPGPQFPLYLLGREMQELVPVAFLPEDHALAIAAMSYNGKLDFGLLGDYDAMPDLDALAEGFRESLDEMVQVAREHAGAAKGKSATQRKNGSTKKAAPAG